MDGIVEEKIDYNELFRRSKDVPNGKAWFVEQSTKLVYHIVEQKVDIEHAKRSMKLDKDDICQSGIVGLLKAYDSFDESKNNKWSTYASVCITNEILMLFRKARKFSRESISIEEPICRDDNGNVLTLSESMFDEIDQYLEFEDASFHRLVLSNLTISLDDRERLVYKSILENPFRTQQEISNSTGISRSYVSRIMGRISRKAIKIRE